MTPEELQDGLMRYLVDRHNERHREVESVLAVMTKRERQLVREAAVMANVAALPYGERPAKDSEVVADVVMRCLSMPDLYPAMARLARRAMKKRREVAESAER